MADLTVIPRPGMPDLYLAAFLDAYSRKILIWQLHVGEPSADHLADLFRRAVAQSGSPSHFVSDQGPQFTGTAFQQALAEVGTDPRIGAVGQKGSIALIERFWRTSKDSLDTRDCPPILPGILAERVHHLVRFYNDLRPHQGLGAVTPAEVFLQCRWSSRTLCRLVVQSG
jgi:transposase InsO family protein